MDKVVTEAVEKLYNTFDRTDVEVESKKIAQKLRETKYNPGSARPLADAILSLLLAARNQGFGPDVVFQELHKVAAEAVNTRWKKMSDGTYQSV
jgi:hypothetical protein